MSVVVSTLLCSKFFLASVKLHKRLLAIGLRKACCAARQLPLISSQALSPTPWRGSKIQAQASLLVDSDGQLHSVYVLALQYNSGRGDGQVGLVYDWNGYIDCAFTARKVDHSRSWYMRQCTRVEAESEKKVSLFARYKKEDGCSGSASTGRRKGRRAPFSDKCSRGCCQWRFQDADKVRKGVGRQHLANREQASLPS